MEGAGVAALLLDFFFFLEGEALGGAEGVRGRFSGCFPCAFSDMAGAAQEEWRGASVQGHLEQP